MRLRGCGLLLLTLGLMLAVPRPAAAAEPGAWGRPERVGLALSGGLGYDPGNRVRYSLLTASALYDYGAIWPHRAPEALRFKVEGELGVGGSGAAERLVAAAGMLALYYVERVRGASWRLYGEAGIGLIYTDFQVPEQGLRVNFNPRFGIGCEFGGRERPYSLALRSHHLSNGGLNSDNRGINALLLQFGRTF